LLVVADLVVRASAALGRTLTNPIRLAGSDRSTVLRCESPESPGGGTVVVKSYPPTPEGADCFIAEAAALEFTAGLARVPDLLAADPRHLLIVMSDLGATHNLADLLLGESAGQARAALLDWARGCADLAVRTAGRRPVLAELRTTFRRAVSAALPGPEGHRAGVHWLERRIREIPLLLEEFSIQAPLPLDDDLDAVASLLRPGEADIFTPGDICPDNNLITSAGVAFIDFESAEFHSALLEAAYLRMPFSTCWCVFRVPAELARAAEEEYRTTVSGVIPDLASDEIWRPGVRRAMAAWTLHAMTYLFDRCLVADGSMNADAAHAPTRRQLLRYRWRMLSEELDQAGELPAIAALARQLLATTVSWRAPALPLYPAFRG
jgi:hypothetical protein